MRWQRRLSPRPPYVFLSYRRGDTRDQTGRLHQTLSEAIGKKNVFMDTAKEERTAEDFMKVILAMIEKSDWVVVVIGHQWAVDADGTKRMGENDFVRMEIAHAIKRGIPVIPFLVDGAKMPDDLPADIAEVAKRDGFVTDHVHFIDDATRLARLIDRRLVTVQGLGCIAIAVTLALCALYRRFDFAQVGMEDMTTSTGDWLCSHEVFRRWTGLCPTGPDDHVVLVAIDKASQSQEKLGKFGKSWRPYHAMLVDTLVNAGATTIAFDIAFDTVSEFDQPLIDAFTRAKTAKKRIIVGGGRVDQDDAPYTSIEKAATALGLTCIGQQIGRSSITPIGALHGPEGQQSLLLSLPLLAAYPLEPRWWLGFWDVRPQIVLGDTSREVLFYGSFRDKVGQRGCEGLRIDDDVVWLIRRLSRPEAWDDSAHRVAYEDLVPKKKDSLSLAVFDHAVVLIGLVDGEDRIATPFAFGSDSRSGVVLHADTVSNLMQHAALRPMGDGAAALLTLSAGLLGWSLRRLTRAASFLIPTVASLALVTIAVITYLKTPVLVSVPYALLALVAIYACAGRPFPRVRGS